MDEGGLRGEVVGGVLDAAAAIGEGGKDKVAGGEESVPPNSLPEGSQAYRSTGKGNKVHGWEVEAQGSLGES